MTAVLIVFLVGAGLGAAGGGLFAFWWLVPQDVPTRTWRYSCTCGWRCDYVASVTIAPSYLRCDQCKGVAVRRREPVPA